MLNSIILRSLLLYLFLSFVVWRILSENNLIGVSKGTKKAKKDVDISKIELKKKERLNKILNYCSWISENIGFHSSEEELEELEYRIIRLNMRSETLKRSIKPIELIGLFRGINLIGIFLAILNISMTFKLTGLVFLLLCFSKKIFLLVVDNMIAEEDMQLEKEFPNLYLKLYSRLLKRGRVKLAPSIDDYIETLDYTSNVKNVAAIKKFAMNYRNYIELYPDEITATEKLKQVYKTATIVRFCTLAEQALRDVDNGDNLLTFKMELLDKRKIEIDENGEKIVRQGRKSLIIVYIILGEIILLSWIAKLSMLF